MRYRSRRNQAALAIAIAGAGRKPKPKPRFDSRDLAVCPPEDICYLGHEYCWDGHESERLADEADWEQELLCPDSLTND
jgi:hypothetical protein